MASQSGSLYETNILTRISSSSHKPAISSVLALARPEAICLVVNNTIHLVANTEATNALATAFEFECAIDAVGWSDDGALLVAGDRGRVIHFICPSTEQVLHSLSLAPEKLTTREESVDTIFKGIQFTRAASDEGLMDLLVMSSDGTIFIFEKLHLEQLKSALSQGGLPAATQLQGMTKLSKLDVGGVHDVWSSSLLPLHTPHPPSIITTGRGGAAVCIWQKSSEGSYVVHDSISYIMQGTGVSKCVVTSDGGYLVTLTDSHMVAVWLLPSLILVNVWTGDLVEDLSICHSASCSGSGDHASCPDRLCLITENTCAQRTLSIVSLPGMSTVFSMEMLPAAILCSGYVTEESLYFIDTNHHTSEKLCLQIKHLVQALPENRLTTLLAQQKFEEAEAFAREFDLNLELVYKKKSQVLNNLLVRASVTEEEEEEAQSPDVWGSLLHCLDQIKDENFVVDLALCSPYPSLHMTHKMLHYTKNRLQPVSSRNDAKAVRIKVCAALDKLTTFQMILREDPFSSEAWHLFLESSLLEELRLRLQLGNLREASCIWSRHQVTLISELDSNNLLPLVEAIPDSITSSQLASWLTGNIVPFLLQHTPESLGDFLSWVEQRARMLELTEKELWPNNALDMVTGVLESIHSFRNLAARMTIQTHTLTLDFFDDENSPLSGLKTLQKTLTDMQYLHSSLQCPVCLSDYEKESREAVVFRLLDKVVATELVSPTVQSKVSLYVQRHNLKLDTVLLQYVKLFLSSAPRYSTGLSDSPWEAKAIAVIQTITDRELYVTGCVELLTHIHPPWSEAVESLVQECLNVDHPSVAMLQDQYRLLQLKKMLHGYGVRDFNFSDGGKGRLYIRRILAHGGEECLRDALQVAEMYQLNTSQVYMHHLMNLGLQDKLDAGSEILRGLPRKDQVEVAQKTFGFAFSKLQLPFSAKLDDPEAYIGTSRVALVCLRVLKKNLKEGDACSLCDDWCSIGEKIQLFERLLGLQVEFSEYLTPQDLDNRRKCKKMFEEKVLEFLAQQASGVSSKHYHNAVRYCHLLGYSEEQLLRQVAGVCARQNQAGRASDICWTLLKYSPTPSTALLLLSTAQKVLERMERDPSLVAGEEIPSAYKVSTMAASTCHPDDLLDSLEMCQVSSFVQSVHLQCEGGGESEGVEEASHLEESSPLTRWSWSPRFIEDGLVLERSVVMAEAAHYAMARMPLQGDGGGGWSHTLPFHPRQALFFTGGDLQPLLDATSQLTATLQDNSHSQLSLRCTVQTLETYCLWASLSGDLMAPKTVLQQGQTVVCEQLNTLTNKVLSSRRIDHDYALALLLMLPPEQAIEKLQRVRSRSASSYSKVIALCKLAIDYGHLTGQTSVIGLSSSILSSAEWGKRLGKYKISFTEAFRGGPEEKRKVISQLFRNTEVDFQLLTQYCHDFGIQLQSVLPDYLKVLLTEWGSSCYQARTATVVAHLQNHRVLHDLLADLLMRKVIPYDYEKIVFILQQLAGTEATQLEIRAEQGLRLLDCLKRYSRVSPPLEFERQWFVNHYSAPSNTTQEVTLPEASGTRLPFHPLLYGTPLSIIGPELSIETVGKLTLIAKILNLSDDDFYSTAIENIIKPQVSSGSVAPSSIRFSEVTPLLDKIQDHNFALRVAKWLAKELQTDEDRLEALKAAVSIALKWKESAQTKDEYKAAVEKVEEYQALLRISKTDCVLRDHKLDLPEYGQLCNHGGPLIMALYTDVPISKKLKPTPPVHSVAAKIAIIHNLNLEKIRSKLTEMWLPSTASAKRDMDITQMSMLEDPTELSDEEESEDQLNMKRLIYLLNVPENLEAHAELLLKWAKRTSSPASTTCLSRVRALQILFAIVPTHLIEAISDTSIGMIRDYMQRVMFVSELDALHMPSSLSAFQSCNKERLVKSLWKNHAQEPRALRLTCELCLHYQIFDGNLWSRMLEQLLNMGMLSYLRHVLKTIASRAGCWNISSLPAVWQKALLAPFQGATVPLTTLHKQECLQSLEMLYGCPFLFELDVTTLVSAFCSVELRAHALSAALVITSHSERNKVAEDALRDLKPEEFVALLDQLLVNGVDQDVHLRGVDELVYMHLNSTGQHKVLLGSSHFSSYVNFLISRKLMDSLLLKTLQTNRVKEAIQLVEMYNSYHQSSQMQGMDALKEYMTSHKLQGVDVELLDLQ